MSRTAAEMMNPELLTATPAESAAALVEKLVAFEVSSCPVVRDDGRLLGMVGLRDLALAPSDAQVTDVVGPGGMTVAEDATVAEIAELMAETSGHQVVVVAANGHVLGVVSTIDVIREFCDLPPRWPDRFPHADARFDIRWSDQAPLEFSRLGIAPAQAGIISLICSTLGAEDRVAWSEYTTDLRNRLIDLVAEPTAEVPALCDLLQGRSLRFRIAVLEDDERGRAVVDALQRLSGHAGSV